MADPPPGSGDNTGVGPDRGSTTDPLRWVKVSGLIIIVLLLLVGGLMLFGGGLAGDGPERHAPGVEAPGGHRPPESGH